MKRVLIAATLLAASLVAAQVCAAAQESKRETGAAERPQPERWKIEPAADLTGKGRLLIEWPERVPMGHQRVEIHSAEGVEKPDRGKGKFELLPGAYDVVVAGKRVAGVPVEKGKETRLLVGLLRVVYKDMSKTEVYDADKKTLLVKDYGTLNLALPVGKYWVRIGPRLVEVELKEGETAEF
jgi:Ni/Co efflux regulator RcnB